VNKVHHADGDLYELTRDKTPIVMMPRSSFGSGAFIARDRGYRPGWVAHKFKERFGHWPNGLDHLTPVPPSDTTWRWVKSRQIAFAKSRSRSAPNGRVAS
jgi:DNA repair protein RadD